MCDDYACFFFLEQSCIYRPKTMSVLCNRVCHYKKKKKTRVWIYDNNKYRFGRFVSSTNRPAALRYNAVYLTTNNCRFFVLYKIYYVRVMAFCRQQQLLGRPFWPRASFGIRHSYASRLNIVITCRAVEARFFFF